MGLFNFKKIKTKEIIDLEDYKNKIDRLLNLDRYISKKEYINLDNNLFDIYNKFQLMKDENVFDNWIKNNKVDKKLLESLLNFYINSEKIIENHNIEFVKNHKNNEKEYLDNILVDLDKNICLDDEQRDVILNDEDYTLVVAGAGAGKTTTLAAKAKYIVDHNYAKDNEILVISFTNKATKELKERLNKINIKAKVSTFHSIGHSIIRLEDENKYSIINDTFMYKSIKDYLKNKLDDEYFIKKILLFFASYLQVPFDDAKVSELFKTISKDDITTIKDDIKETLENYKTYLTSKKTTIIGEKVRSIDECNIANFLFIHGIEYEYEPIYKYNFFGATRPYTPDFLIHYKGRDIYLEHFGISEDGHNSRFSDEELELYKKNVNDKIILHRKHNTELIYTFTKYNDGLSLITHLKDLLISRGIELNAIDSREIYKKIADNAEEKYFDKLTLLICNFIHKFKVNNYSLSKFDEWKTIVKDDRTLLFLEIAYQCFLIYQKALSENNTIDFEDMINNASNVLDDLIKQKYILNYKYIFIDEYQDISNQRFDLADKLRQCSNAKIIAVGDDWQSIYRFNGSKIELFTSFKEKMGYAKILKIQNTYRNAQELIDIAGNFVMKNDQQIKKQLKSNKTITNPINIISYDDEKKNLSKDEYADIKNHIAYRFANSVIEAIEDIVKNNTDKCEIALISRYNFEFRNLSKYEELFKYDENRKLHCIKYPNVKLIPITAHSSKGLGFDNVIIINGRDDVVGFPSKIEDDPVMKLVIKDDEKEIDFAEERRLFYVALTRTKNRVYIITPQLRPSKFILELMENNKINLIGEKLRPIENPSAKLACPHCGYPLQIRYSKIYGNKQTKLFICSNDPEVCGFMTNDLSGKDLSICKCPACIDGYLIVKRKKNENGFDDGERFLGCTNYNNGTCNYVINKTLYSNDKNKLTKHFYSKKILIENIYLCNYQIEELSSIIFNALYEIYNKYPKFKINLNTITYFLTGSKDEITTKWHLFELKGYGIIDSKYQKLLKYFIKELKDYDYIYNDSNSLKYTNKKLYKEDLIAIYQSLYVKNKI